MEYKKIDWQTFREQAEKDSLQRLNSGVSNALNTIKEEFEKAQDKLKLIVLTDLVTVVGYNAILSALLNAEYDVTDFPLMEGYLPMYLLKKLKEKGNVTWFLDLVFYTYNQIIKREKEKGI